MINFIIEKTKNLSFFRKIEKALKSARIKTSYTQYLKILYISTFISIPISIFIFWFLNFINVKEIYLIYSTLSIPLIVFLFIYYYPFVKVNEHARKIETELPFAISHLASIAESNLPPTIMFRIISTFREYKALGKEFEEIMRRMEVYGLDFVTAIKNVAETTPSISFQKFLNSMITTIQSGGDIKNFLKVMYDKTSYEWKAEREEFIQKLSLFSEIYVGVVVLAPLLLVSMVVLMSSLQTGNLFGLNINDWLMLGTFVILPVINVLSLLFFKGIEIEM
jgi:flagellar protein FlaJ